MGERNLSILYVSFPYRGCHGYLISNDIARATQRAGGVAGEIW